MPGLSPRQIETFLAVMNYGSVTAAAQSLHKSQPTVSRMVDRFEREVGFKVFDRKHGRLIPTAEAELFLSEVRSMYQGIDHLTEIARQLQDRLKGAVRIAVFPAYADKWICDRIHRVSAGKEDVLVSIIPIPSSETANVIARQKFDIGISSRATNRPGLRCEEIATARFVCILPSNHPLCSRTTIHATDLSNQSFVSLTSLDEVRSGIDVLFERLGVERKIEIECAAASTICHFVGRGLGAGLVDRNSAEEYRHVGFEIREFEPRLEFGIYMIELEDRPTSALLDEFREVLKEGGVNSS